MLVEEEDVLNEHQPALHRGSAKRFKCDGRILLTASAATEKKPLRIRAARYEWKVVEAAHHAMEPRAIEM